MLSSAAVERNAIIGDDAESRKRDIPIVQLNPGSTLNWKYEGENALRAAGLPYSIIRATGELGWPSSGLGLAFSSVFGTGCRPVRPAGLPSHIY